VQTLGVQKKETTRKRKDVRERQKAKQNKDQEHLKT
jgi:hypothetical protein